MYRVDLPRLAVSAGIRCSLAGCIVLASACVGCGGSGDATAPSREPAQTDSGSAGAAMETTEQLAAASPDTEEPTAPADAAAASHLSSIEAAKLAYGEAVKWRSDAVFWYMVAHTLRKTHLDADWASTGRSGYWLINFANPENDEELTVIIEGTRVAKTSKSNRRKNPCKPEYPKDRPGVSLRDTARVVLGNGAPAHVLPQVCYAIDNMDRDFDGRPVWLFSYEERQEDAADLYYAFVVDGLTGKLLEIHNAAGDSLTPAELEALRHPPAGRVYEPSHQKVVEAFLALVAKGNVEEAVTMMDADMTPNAEMRQMWAGNLAVIDRLRVTSIEAHAPEKWKKDLQTFHARLEVKLDDGAPYVGWDEGVNERWIQVRREGGVWRIHAIGTGP